MEAQEKTSIAEMRMRGASLREIQSVHSNADRDAIVDACKWAEENHPGNPVFYIDDNPNATPDGLPICLRAGGLDVAKFTTICQGFTALTLKCEECGEKILLTDKMLCTGAHRIKCSIGHTNQYTLCDNATFDKNIATKIAEFKKQLQ